MLTRTLATLTLLLALTARHRPDARRPARTWTAPRRAPRAPRRRR